MTELQEVCCAAQLLREPEEAAWERLRESLAYGAAAGAEALCVWADRLRDSEEPVALGPSRTADEAAETAEARGLEEAALRREMLRPCVRSSSLTLTRSLPPSPFIFPASGRCAAARRGGRAAAPAAQCGAGG